MTVRLSPFKVRKILAGYFSGVTQTRIARKAGVDQSCVSVYATRFKKRAAVIGIPAAGKEYGVQEEVGALRSLATELAALGLTAEDAKDGVAIMRRFLELGVAPEQHGDLVALCHKVGDPGFVAAAMKLSKIESEDGVVYEEVVVRFEDVTAKLPQVEQQLEHLKAEIGEAEVSLAAMNEELAAVGKELLQNREKADAEAAKIEQGLLAKLKAMEVTMEEVKQVAKLKVELGSHGLDLTTFIKLAEEVGYEKDKG